MGKVPRNGFKRLITIFTLVLGLQTNALGQFEINGQIVERAEIRHGYGTLIPNDSMPAAFVTSRARMEFSYKTDKFKAHTSIQDVRIWGNAPQIKITDLYLSLYEAWAEVMLDTCWSIKAGRQELNYDNVRFLGNVDWVMQGRTHDFVLVKFERNKFKVHAGAGYNQDAEKLYNNLFTIANQYKTAQFFRAEYATSKSDISALFWNDGRQYINKDSTGKITGQGVRYMQTAGLPTLKYRLNNTIISGFFYYQFGRDVTNKKVEAFDASLQATQEINYNAEKKNQITLTLGAEVLSGSKAGETENRSFNPLYGTNHVHNGYMDYFYVGGRHDNSVGLVDLYLRSKYDVNKHFFCSLTDHAFTSYAPVTGHDVNVPDNYLCTEIDFAAGYILAEFLSVQAGYSQMFSSHNMQVLKRVNSPASNQDWGYIMLIFKPKSNNKFMGLIF